jgi:ELWxxDGT repeat protein
LLPAASANTGATAHEADPSRVEIGQSDTGVPSGGPLATGAHLLVDLNPGGASSSPTDFTNMDGTALFLTSGGALWRSDGTTTTFIVHKPIASALWSGSSRLAEVKGRVVFLVSLLNELWVTDGTDAGTMRLVPGAQEGGSVSGLVSAGERVFYMWEGSGMTWTLRELCVTDGSAGGTGVVWVFSGYLQPTVRDYSLIAAGSGAHFTRRNRSSGYELWKSDGTFPGTLLVTALGTTAPSGLTDVGGTAFFAIGSTLWKSDGTGAGTQPVRDFAPGVPRNLAAARGRLFFAVDDGVHGEELWTSDGTEVGTSLVKDINPGAAGSGPHALTAARGVLFFAADDGVHGSEPWTSDGTEAGTSLVADIAAGTASSDPQELVAAFGEVYLQANDGVTGAELWRTDGTPAGTVLVADVGPGALSGAPQWIRAVGDRIFFSADDGTYGREPWVLDVSPRRLEDSTGDGLGDVLVRHDGGDVRVLASNGARFSSAVWTRGFVPYRYDVSFADVTGDARADIVSRRQDTGDVEVFRSTGTSFAYAPGSGPGGVWSYGWGTSYELFLADVTGDGRADLIGRNAASGDVYAFPATPGRFTSAAPGGLWSYGWSGGYDLRFADVTGDGRADLVGRYLGPTAGLYGDVYVATSTGTRFESPVRWTYGFSSGYELFAADADGDGRSDLVARYLGPATGLTGDVFVLYSTGSSFSWNGNFDRWASGWGPSEDVLVRDVTGDGKADLVGRSRTGTGELRVAPSTGAAFLAPSLWADGVDPSYQLR